MRGMVSRGGQAVSLDQFFFDSLEVGDDGEPLRAGVLALAAPDAICRRDISHLAGVCITALCLGLVLEQELAVHGLEEVGNGD